MARPRKGELIGLMEIAVMLNVQKETTWRWRNRKVLPEPIDVISGTPVWMVDDIRAWAYQTGRLAPPGEPAEAPPTPVPAGA